MRQEAYEAAVRTYTRILENHPHQSRLINDLLHDARLSLKRSQSKDYYKVLGVDRDADNRHIKSAYRKLSKRFHPDKAATHGFSKVEAERNMARVNEAYEVLSDPQLRARFDQGIDPKFPFGLNMHGFRFNPGDPFQNMPVWTGHAM